MGKKLIFNRQIAQKLTAMGFSIIETMENRNKEHIKIFVFEDTDALNQSFTKILESRKSINKWRYNTNGNNTNGNRNRNTATSIA